MLLACSFGSLVESSQSTSWQPSDDSTEKIVKLKDQ